MSIIPLALQNAWYALQINLVSIGGHLAVTKDL